MSLTLALTLACLAAEPPMADGADDASPTSTTTSDTIVAERDATDAPFAPTESYEVRDLRGWTVRISPSLR
ncbi:MAG: hypothetical protein ACO38W_11085, partial [Phycisphaerales bacterium]